MNRISRKERCWPSIRGAQSPHYPIPTKTRSSRSKEDQDGYPFRGLGDRELPDEKQGEVLDFVEFLRAHQPPKRPLRDVAGLWKGLVFRQRTSTRHPRNVECLPKHALSEAVVLPYSADLKGHLANRSEGENNRQRRREICGPSTERDHHDSVRYFDRTDF